ncbi:delta(3,5)-Delta(2,4)-dienoyl-CoA isomerase, mitochondrial [Anabrus simplex]|uniref:delta(3,5)-Delta(2,4)-dienoyl-CoA isomerase, mitochondrial n=1 Tax=Anabrus simplex TaxID=316456 RepID=UPI0034DCE17E
MYTPLVRRVGRFTALAQKQLAAATYSNDAAPPKFEKLAVSVPKPFVYHVELNRPDKLNTFNEAMWKEIRTCFETLGEDPNCRVIILSAIGRLFSGGIDLNHMAQTAAALAGVDDIARRAKVIRASLKSFQETFTSLEKCPKPVITAIHGACVGAALNMITAADIRFCTNDAWFSLAEVNIGMAADVGALQRLPKIVGCDSLVRELAYTGRKLPANEAKESGLVSRVYDSKESMINGAIELATEIASKSPVAVQVTKRNLVYSRDHSVQEGLDNILDWNMSMLQSEDLMNAVMAQMSKSSPPEFSKL